MPIKPGACHPPHPQQNALPACNAPARRPSQLLACTCKGSSCSGSGSSRLQLQHQPNQAPEPAGAVASTREQGAEPTPPPSPTENQHRMALANRRVAELDIFADNVDTILEQQAQGAPVEGPAMGNRALQDNFDDPEGYYNFQVRALGAGMRGRGGGQAACSPAGGAPQAAAELWGWPGACAAIPAWPSTLGRSALADCLPGHGDCCDNNACHGLEAFCAQSCKH